MTQIAQNLEKAVPSLALFLNKDAQEIRITDKYKIDLGYQQENNNGSILKIDNILYNNMFFSTQQQLISANSLFQKLIEYLYSSTFLKIKDILDYKQELLEQHAKDKKSISIDKEEQITEPIDTTN